MALLEIGRRIPVVFAVHPRTRKALTSNGLWAVAESESMSECGLRMIDPLGYLDFLSLTAQAQLVLTDSGGLQEESTALGIPCLTLRDNTERPITVQVGTNVLVGVQPRRIIEEAHRILDGDAKLGRVPEMWDGRTAERIADLYDGYLSSRPSPSTRVACL
jgi:UDP-N-acetylglucosamine 2-epimerase (non-hydrolysing)